MKIDYSSTRLSNAAKLATSHLMKVIEDGNMPADTKTEVSLAIMGMENADRRRKGARASALIDCQAELADE